eukprot:TRINITY_DN2278_c0_g2_i4.p1 TRINITY_DN2278_c0_g2~~TRINITY_DN2278_c0_g2_i4.p1  ORF type:complete len:344 (-),score=48.42 TRINITY_DN2278_c0_g2_i4:29-934(-)
MARFVRARVRFHGYNGECQQQTTSMTSSSSSLSRDCHASISVRATGLLDPAILTCTQIDPSTCEMEWYMQGRGANLQASASLTFSSLGSSLSARAVWWNVSVDSVYPDLDSFTTGFLYPTTENEVFRSGQEGPINLVQMTVIPTTFSTYRDSKKIDRAFTIGMLTRQRGRMVNQSSFYDDHVTMTNPGVYLDLQLLLSSSVFSKRVVERLPAIAAVSNVVALIGGIMTFARIVLTILLKVAPLQSDVVLLNGKYGSGGVKGAKYGANDGEYEMGGGGGGGNDGIQLRQRGGGGGPRSIGVS